MIFREIRRCKTKGALEVLPAEAVALQLDQVERALRAERFDVVNAAVLLVASRDDITETTIWEDGKLLVKSLDPREAHRSAARVFHAATGKDEDSMYEDYVAAGRVDGQAPSS